MLELDRVPPTVLSPVLRVVRAAVAQADGLTPQDIMLVGACCRDILHSALGHTFPNTATSDLDLALGLSSWQAFESLASAFTPIGHTGIRFRIAEVVVDLLPFGGVEEPPGRVSPPSRAMPRRKSVPGWIAPLGSRSKTHPIWCWRSSGISTHPRSATGCTTGRPARTS